MARVSLAAFVARRRDDLMRFRVAYERARARHGNILAEEQELDEWMRLFADWLREGRERRPRSNATTIKRK